MNELDFTLDQLRGMIGIHVRHEGRAYEIVEVLEDGPCLVLRDLHMDPVIQANQHGDAARRVPHTVTIAVLNPARDALTSVFLSLDLLED